MVWARDAPWCNPMAFQFLVSSIPVVIQSASIFHKEILSMSSFHRQSQTVHFSLQGGAVEEVAE